MPTSQNGYSANDRSVIATFTVPGTTRKYALRKGDTSVILLDFLAWFHLNIEPIDTGTLDDWGYAERTIRGSSTTLSNHASGTAADVNALKHVLGKRGTFSADQIRRIREKLKFYEGALRWGGDYSGRPDEMHVEINAGAAVCKRVADKIRGVAQYVPKEDDDLNAEQARQLATIYDEITKRLQNRRGPEGSTITGGGADTVLGYAALADGSGYRIEHELTEINSKLDELLSLARTAGVDPEVLTNAIQSTFASGLSLTGTLAPAERNT